MQQQMTRFPWLQASVVAAIALIRAALTIVWEPGLTLDSLRYRNPAHPLRVFRFDRGQGPGQLLQMICLLPVKEALAIQALAVTLLWGWAAAVATRGMRQRWFWLLIAFSLSPWWMAWDWMVLSEALTLGGMALFAAAAARWLKERDSGTSMIVGACVALLTRPLVVPLVLGILAVVVIARRALPGSPRRLAVLVFVVLIAGVQTVMFNRALAHYNYLPRPMTLQSVQASDRFGARIRLHGYLELAEKMGMPACPQARKIPFGLRGARAIRQVPCPGFSAWLDNGGVPWWSELRYNSGPTIKEIAAGRWLRRTWRPYFHGGADIPRTVEWDCDVIMWLVLGIACVALLRPGRDWLPRAAVVMGSLGFAMVLILTDGNENWRHILPALVGLVPFAVGSLSRSGTGLDRSHSLDRGASLPLRRLDHQSGARELVVWPRANRGQRSHASDTRGAGTGEGE